MKPYSQDLRIRVLTAVDRGVPREEVAKTFSVSVPTIKRWLRRRAPRETGGVEARPITGRPRLKGAALEGWLPEHLEKSPDLTLEEHREAFKEAHAGGVLTVSVSTVRRELARLPGGWPLKKSRP